MPATPPTPHVGSAQPGTMQRDALRGAVRNALEEQLVLDHLPLADAMARKYARGGHDVEDVVQVARMALVKAARRFDPAVNPHFDAYARPTVSGEIKRYLRDTVWMVQPPRGIQELHTEVLRAHPVLCQSLGREPTLVELADHLCEEPGLVAEAIASHNSLQPDSLDVICGDLPGGDHVPAVDGEVFGAVDDELSLAQALSSLDAAEKKLLHLRFYEEQSQQRIGEELDMSQVQVSRALSRILVRLQRQILNRFPGHATSSRRSAA